MKRALEEGMLDCVALDFSCVHETRERIARDPFVNLRLRRCRSSPFDEATRVLADLHVGGTSTSLELMIMANDIESRAALPAAAISPTFTAAFRAPRGVLA